MEATFDKRFGCKIILFEGKSEGPLKDTVEYWTGFKLATYRKWQWYFRYRAALYQVKHPQQYVKLHEFNYDYVPPKTEKIKRLKDRIRATKAKITQWTNVIESHQQNNAELFPVTEHPDYERSMDKIESKKATLNELELELNCLTE